MTMTDNDDVGKLFVGGLSWETTKENLQSYFSKFGEVVDSVVMKNNETGRSRGFGFVTFKDPSCVAAVLQSKPHELNGRTVDPKECTPRSMQKNKRAAPQFKVFLGGLPPDVTETDIRNAMAKFGRVSQVMIMCDQETKKCRGFGFLSFESEDSIDQVCGQRFVNINGKQIECKRAEPRDSYRRNAGQPYNAYQSSQNGSMKPSSFGPGSSAGYQTPGWNAPQQPYMMQGSAYGGYQNYNTPPVAPAYGSNSAAPPYNNMPSAQYSQSSYPSYGTGTQYNYAQTPNASNYTQPAARAYSQPPPVGYSNPAANSYSQAAPVPEAKAPNVSSTYGAGSNAPGAASGYGPPKAYTSTFPKAQTYASTDGMGYSGQGVASASKNIGYHPYRR